MIRITGGRLKGRQIECLKGNAIRPTTGFVRESIFSMLGPAIHEARVLDLFGGSGMLGFESISRGATYVAVVEKNKRHAQLLDKNRERLGILPSNYQVRVMDVFSWCERQPPSCPESERFDVIFLDPPFALEGIETIVEWCLEKQLLRADGVIVWEHPSSYEPVFDTAHVVKSRRHGDATVCFINYPDSPVQVPPADTHVP